MQRLHCIRAAGMGLTSFVLLFFPSTGKAQDKKGDEVQFETADKVEIHGTFVPSAKGGKAPCVILLHKYGMNRQQKGMDELTQVLSKEYAVLSFDFRGHGDSTTVTPMNFWRVPQNSSMIKNAPKMGNKISYKDFPKDGGAYLPMLANDVTAAKRYLDQMNDNNACNSSNIIVIGCEEGAAIGAFWIATEWQRVRMVKNAFGGVAPDRTGKVEGEDIAGAIWLSIPQTLANVNLAGFLKGPNNKIRDKVPMAFFYGDKDTKAANAANTLFNDMKKASTKDRMEYTTVRPKKTKLAGAGLIAQKFGGDKDETVEEEISIYLEKVMQKRGLKAPTKRDVEKAPPLVLIPLNQFGFR